MERTIFLLLVILLVSYTDFRQMSGFLRKLGLHICALFHVWGQGVNTVCGKVYQGLKHFKPPLSEILVPLCYPLQHVSAVSSATGGV